MAKKTSNDNEPTRDRSRAAERDAPPLAAILLVESLIHGLVARSVISVDEAVEIINVTVQVVGEIDENAGGSSPMSRRSVVILEAISSSLAIDRTRD